MTDSQPNPTVGKEKPIKKTLRDEIAISVLNGLIIAGFDVKVIPANAYMIADLMIHRMKKENGELNGKK